MKSPSFLPFVLTPFLIIFMAGCESVREDFARGLDQPVQVVSFPNNAEVIINGQPVGRTPVRVMLPRRDTYEVQVRAAGYQPEVRYFTPRPNAGADNFVKFGLMEDLGLYVDLRPGVMEARLTHSLIPRSPGAQPFREFAARANEVDRLLQNGQIDPIEHKIISRQLVSFYAN